MSALGHKRTSHWVCVMSVLPPIAALLGATVAKSPREEFKRVRNSLHARGLIGIRDDFAWKA